MAKLTKTTLFKAQMPKPETAMDKTTRNVKQIVDGEAEERLVKMTRLRNARLEREAHTPKKPAAPARKTRTPKA